MECTGFLSPPHFSGGLSYFFVVINMRRAMRPATLYDDVAASSQGGNHP